MMKTSNEIKKTSVIGRTGVGALFGKGESQWHHIRLAPLAHTYARSALNLASERGCLMHPLPELFSNDRRIAQWIAMKFCIANEASF